MYVRGRNQKENNYEIEDMMINKNLNILAHERQIKERGQAFLESSLGYNNGVGERARARKGVLERGVNELHCRKKGDWSEIDMNQSED